MHGLRTIKKMNAKATEESDNNLVGLESKKDCTLDHIKTESDGFQMASDETKNRDDRIDTLFCDTSGVGKPYERALTVDQLVDELEQLIKEHGSIEVGIVEFGQFQAYLGVWPYQN